MAVLADLCGFSKIQKCEFACGVIISRSASPLAPGAATRILHKLAALYATELQRVFFKALFWNLDVLNSPLAWNGVVLFTVLRQFDIYLCLALLFGLINMAPDSADVDMESALTLTPCNTAQWSSVCIGLYLGETEMC